ncbi:acetylornithine deacetylase/succinyl-diaminopimelate desuccinylase family protein [Variovorax terrae]|uniref:Acetylornithine deacetylase/succinyl-diaminopimelate desuccinylase family protein n=1 Tax=Variovorax terrae TaxID=2923278 RepID=A0A9X1VZD2_9BURK|nr:acetylornithine deacetylase/succinyl-diaminopimelate desuccinylase family protein [Variovorax terrae]MCJ0764852.1 acetylornithine deacetylase/succinyl-diaminopimelate desuccinylase family protein [Variovorax terrae]
MSLNTDSLLKRIEAKRDEVVALTQDLIRIPTINPPGDAYEACARFLGERLQRRGFAVEYVRAHGAPGDSDSHPRTNVVARHAGSGAGECVHFNSHIDVVEVGSGWTTDPFGGEVKDGKVYGRGACDMKGGLASSVIACEALLEEGIALPGALEISGTVDEESGGYGGVGHLASLGYFSKPRVHHVIIPEPLGVDRICLGHRGVWWAEVETRGRIAHGSMPFLGDSAINHMSAFIHLLETQLLPRLNQRRTAVPVEPPGARVSTLNINSIHGGHVEQRFATDAQGRPGGDLPAPVVAHSCRTVLDRRFIAEENLEAVKQEIVDMLDELKRTRPGFDYGVREIMSFVPTATPRDAPVVDATARAIARVLGREPSYIASPGTYDQKHIVRTGQLNDCIAYGPGILDLAHQPDEYVGIRELVDSAKIMALAALQLTGAMPRR